MTQTHAPGRATRGAHDPMPTSPTSTFEIRLDRLDHNIAAIKACIAEGKPPGRVPRFCGVIKADAYGLGMDPIARRLVQRGVDMVAVYSPEQAEQLAQLNLATPILVFMRMTEISRNDPLYRYALTGKLHLSIHDRAQLLELNKLGQMQGMQVHVQLYVDTGMSRGGLRPDQLAAMLDEMPTLRHVKLTGVYTHPTTADTDATLTLRQMMTMDSVLLPRKDKLPPDMLVHIANTHATLRSPRFHRSMVRVGLGLYGYGPETISDLPSPGTTPEEEAATPPPVNLPKLVHVLRWVSRIIHVTRQPAGAHVGYCGTHTLTRDSILGVIPVGYADGYPKSLSNLSVVALPGLGKDGGTMHVAALGRVNCDQLVVDLTDVPAFAGSEPPLGAVVELISDDPTSPCSVPALAKLAGTHPYEIICRLSARIPRKYV